MGPTDIARNKQLRLDASAFKAERNEARRNEAKVSDDWKADRDRAVQEVMK